MKVFKILFIIPLFILFSSCNEDKNVIDKVNIKKDTSKNNSINPVKSKENCDNAPSSQIYNQTDLNEKDKFQSKVLKIEDESKNNSKNDKLAEVVFSSKPIVDINKIESPIVKTSTGDRISKKILSKFLPELKNYEKFVPATGQSVDITDFTTSSTSYKSKNGFSLQMNIYDYGLNNDFQGKSYFYKLPTDDTFEIKEVKVKSGKSYYTWNKLKKNGIMYAYINNRFYVSIEGYNISEINLLINALSKIDFTTLNKLTNKK